MRTLVIAAALISGCATLQGQDKPGPLDPRPVSPANDPVNQWVVSSTVDGLVVAVTIDGGSVTLDSATPARIPRTATARRTARGDQVTAVGLAGGARVSEARVPDGVLNVQEGVGLVRVTKRQVFLALPAPRALDTVEISAPATGATARIDVRGAYSAYCKSDKPDPKFCPVSVNLDGGNLR